MQQIKLSIVVTIHNPGSRLTLFLNSLAQQHYKKMEVIIIDGGSTDDSLLIISKYKEHIQNMSLIIQSNQGVSAARNKGIFMAQGDYIAFPSINDTLYPELYATLMAEADKSKPDAVQCNAYRHFVHSGTHCLMYPYAKLETTKIISGVSWLEKSLHSRSFINTLCVCIYNLSFIKQHSLSFKHGLNQQDILWNTEFMYLSNRVKYIENPLYIQNYHTYSSVGKTSRKRDKIYHHRNSMKTIRKLILFNSRNHKSTRKIKILHWQIADEILNVCHCARREKDTIIKKQISKDFFKLGMHWLILREASGIKQHWHALIGIKKMFEIK